jgi:hypothetical protein
VPDGGQPDEAQGRKDDAIADFQAALLLDPSLIGARDGLRRLGVAEAQLVGDLLPATYFLRVVRGILLKGNGLSEILPNVWPLLIFLFVVGSVALLRYRETLD